MVDCEQSRNPIDFTKPGSQHVELIETFNVSLNESEAARIYACDQRRRIRVGRRTLESDKKELTHLLFQGETANILHSAFFLSSANILSASMGVRLSTSTARREFRSSSSSAVKSGS